MMKKWICILSSLCLLLSVLGCGAAEDLPSQENVDQLSQTGDLPVDAGEAVPALTDFGIRLLRRAFPRGGNTLVSPLSVVCALGMTANGAKGETLLQMERTLGISSGALNEWLRDYTEDLPQTDGGKLLSANAIWYRNNGLNISEAFLKATETYYQAEIHAAAFDQDTLRQMNRWVNEKTNGMIPQILERIDANAAVYLLNALAFEAEWETVYREDQVYIDTFTMETGSERTVDFLHSQENKYLENDSCTGFIKYYKDRSYAFAALLPNAGIGMEEFLSTLDGQTLRSLLESPTDIAVYAAIPKFQVEYTAELSGILKEMGMELPFDDSQADFSGLGSAGNGTNLYISKVIHKTFLQLDEQGTRAGAATAVTVYANGALLDVKYVDLDRPFVYMLIDCETGFPFFIGCMMDVTGEPTAFADS